MKAAANHAVIKVLPAGDQEDARGAIQMLKAAAPSAGGCRAHHCVVRCLRLDPSCVACCLDYL